MDKRNSRNLLFFPQREPQRRGRKTVWQCVREYGPRNWTAWIWIHSIPISYVGWTVFSEDGHSNISHLTYYARIFKTPTLAHQEMRAVSPFWIWVGCFSQLHVAKVMLCDFWDKLMQILCISPWSSGDTHSENPAIVLRRSPGSPWTGWHPCSWTWLIFLVTCQPCEPSWKWISPTPHPPPAKLSYVIPYRARISHSCQSLKNGRLVKKKKSNCNCCKPLNQGGFLCSKTITDEEMSYLTSLSYNFSV